MLLFRSKRTKGVAKHWAYTSARDATYGLVNQLFWRYAAGLILTFALPAGLALISKIAGVAPEEQSGLLFATIFGGIVLLIGVILAAYSLHNFLYEKYLRQFDGLDVDARKVNIYEIGYVSLVLTLAVATYFNLSVTLEHLFALGNLSSAITVMYVTGMIPIFGKIRNGIKRSMFRPDGIPFLYMQEDKVSHIADKVRPEFLAKLKERLGEVPENAIKDRSGHIVVR